mgnify:CR=1 FL=1
MIPQYARRPVTVTLLQISATTVLLIIVLTSWALAASKQSKKTVPVGDACLSALTRPPLEIHPNEEVAEKESMLSAQFISDWMRKAPQFAKFRKNVSDHFFVVDPYFAEHCHLDLVDSVGIIKFEYGILAESKNHPPLLNQVIAEINDLGGRVSAASAVVMSNLEPYYLAPEHYFRVDSLGKPVLAFVLPALTSVRDPNFIGVVAHERMHFIRWRAFKNDPQAYERMKSNVLLEESLAIDAELAAIELSGLRLSSGKILRKRNYPEGIELLRLIEQNESSDQISKMLALMVERGLSALGAAPAHDVEASNVFTAEPQADWWPFFNFMRPTSIPSIPWPGNQLHPIEERLHKEMKRILPEEIDKFLLKSHDPALRQALSRWKLQLTNPR